MTESDRPPRGSTRPANASDEALRDWENPNRLLQRYMTAAGAQALGYLLVAVGFIALIYGWWKISKEPIVSFQIPYLVSGGIGGVLLVGIGSVLILTHHMRLDNRRLEVVEEMVAELRDALLVEVERPSPGPAAAAPAPAAPAVAPASHVASERLDDHTSEFDLDDDWSDLSDEVSDDADPVDADADSNGRPGPGDRVSSRPRRRRLLSSDAPAAREEPGAVATLHVVTVAGGTRYHAADCPSVRGKEVSYPETLDGLKPCQLCKPS